MAGAKKSQHPLSPKSAKSVAENPSASTQDSIEAGNISRSVAGKEHRGKPDDTNPDEHEQKPPATTAVLVFVSVMLSVFLVGLDRTIIATVRRHPLEQSSHSNGLY
jgi:hypothetical protein